MSKKIFLSTAIFALILMANYAFADAASELEQEKALVNDYIASDKDAEAADAYQKLVTDFAGNPLLSSAVYDIAETYRNSSKFKQSLQVYKDVVNNWPSSSQAVWAQRGLAVSNVALGKMAEAQSELDKLKQNFSADPNIVEAVFNVADAYYWFSKYSEADSVYKYVTANYPDRDFAMWAQMGLAISSIAQDKDDIAETATQRLISDFNGNEKLPEALFYIAGRYEYSKKYDKAKESFQQIASRFPASPQAGEVPFAFARIKVLSVIETGDAESLKLIESFAAEFESRQNLPGILVHTIAHQIYDKAFEMEAAGLENQSKAYFQKAVDIWEQVTEKNPELTNTADGYNWAGYCYSRLGKYEKAIDCYSKVAEKFPEHNLAWNALFLVGQCYEDMAETELITDSEAKSKIREAYQQLVEEYPDCQAAEIAKSWLYENE